MPPGITAVMPQPNRQCYSNRTGRNRPEIFIRTTIRPDITAAAFATARAITIENPLTQMQEQNGIFHVNECYGAQAHHIPTIPSPAKSFCGRFRLRRFGHGQPDDIICHETCPVLPHLPCHLSAGESGPINALGHISRHA